ncbi:hypothetical protein PG996_005444 [Apiospora saccharicola]|uniref:NACHT-NTPase and P-loop NTPases N-terminal domain-containing protein n=1 Tax=Apiospora saccharicola TaxID=335842 RepID=A0ABR1VP70_9PEZI
MEVLSSAAVIAQVIGQALSLWQQIDLAMQSVRTAPKLLRDLTIQSKNLQRILYNIERSADLHGQAIHSQLKILYSIQLELRNVLEGISVLSHRSTARRSLRALLLRTKDEAKLSDILSRLDRAKGELLLEINVMHVVKTGEIAKGIGRIETQTAPVKVLVEGNTASGRAFQFNGVIGIDDATVSASMSVADNSARERSQQTNLISYNANAIRLPHSFMLKE